MIKNLEIGNYKVFDSFVFRIPTFSINKYYGSSINEITKDKVFREAIFLASPQLYKKIEKNDEEEFGKELIKFQISIKKYYARMCFRSTPFGIFAGCGIGKINSISEIEPLSASEYYTSTRLDMDCLSKLSETISNLDVVKQKIKFYPNSSIYNVGSSIHYTEFTYKKLKRKYTLASAECPIHLKRVLDFAEKGRTINELADLLVDRDISLDEAMEYVHELIDNQILVSEMEPSITGNDLLMQLIDRLKGLQGVSAVLEKLMLIKDLLHKIDNKPIGHSIPVYKKIKYELFEINSELNEKYLLQSDLYVKAKKASISENLVADIIKAIRVLNKLTPKNETSLLSKILKDFYEKFENEQVPLLDALDSEIGCNFGNNDDGDLAPLLNALHFQNTYPEINTSKTWPIDVIMLNKYEKYLKEPERNEIVISDKDLSGLSENWEDLPDTFSAKVQIIRSDKSPAGSLISISEAGGTSAANSLARFCFLNTGICKFVKEIVDIEKTLKANEILAEIVHIPESRVGNVLLRPKLREYEIPYIAKAAVENDYKIPLTDLFLSTPNGKYFQLYSKRLRKNIIPRLTCAHNYMGNSLPLYKFLCLLQAQGRRVALYFKWGDMLSNRAFLPRVRYGNIILSPSHWNITQKEINHIPDIMHNAFFEKVSQFRKEKMIPDKMLLVEGDNKLFIDFTDLLSVQMLFSEIKKGKNITIQEFLLDEEYPVVKYGNEVFTNEVIVGFYKNKI